MQIKRKINSVMANLQKNRLNYIRNKIHYICLSSSGCIKTYNQYAKKDEYTFFYNGYPSEFTNKHRFIHFDQLAHIKYIYIIKNSHIQISLKYDINTIEYIIYRNKVIYSKRSMRTNGQIEYALYKNLYKEIKEI